MFKYIIPLLLVLIVLPIRLEAQKKIPPFPDNYEKKRVLITTDIGGGDPDDIQSMIHYLVYSNMFDLEGIVVGRPRGNVTQMLEIIRAYKKDYRKFLKVSPDYPSPRQLRKLTKSGKATPQPLQGFSTPTAGSRLIVRAARKDDARPLHVLVWGSTTDVAQAIASAPDIRKKIRIFNIGLLGYNYEGDKNATNYIRRFNDIRIIEVGNTLRGMYGTGLNSNSKYGNVGFVKESECLQLEGDVCDIERLKLEDIKNHIKMYRVTYVLDGKKLIVYREDIISAENFARLISKRAEDVKINDKPFVDWDEVLNERTE
jgi:hypothetical protein